MNILLIGNLPEDGQESMLRFTALLQAGLQARGHAVTLLAPSLRLARFGPRYRYGGLPKYLGYLDKFVLFPRQLRRQAQALVPDIIHFTDHASAVYGGSVRRFPVLATCHDLLQIRAARGEIPHQAVGAAGRVHQEWIRRSLACLPHVACVSEQTRTEAVRLTALPETQVSVIPNALNHPYRPITAAAARAQLAGLDLALPSSAQGGFVLHVGGGHWYKNRAGVLAIHAQLRRRLAPPPALVLVGPPLSAAERAGVAADGSAATVTCLPRVTNAQLEALYTLAEALVFPSWEEGFGWPIAEAQACGCPVFTTDRAPMNDVGGKSSVYFDPADPVAAADLIAAAWPGRAARRPLALAEAGRWQLAPMIAAYEALYFQLTR